VVSGFFPRTNFSKTFPHLWQVYSKIGMGVCYSLFCSSGAFTFPDRGRGLVAQVNRERPGIRGNTTNQTTRTRRRIRIFSIVPLLYAFLPGLLKRISVFTEVERPPEHFIVERRFHG